MKIKVGVVQEVPVFFDKHRTIDKLESIVEEYSKQKCQLLVFPESFIPGYPRGFDFGAVVGSRSQAGKELFLKYHQESIALGSQELERIVAISRKHNVYLVIGVTEKSDVHGSLYCSMLYISPEAGLLGVHRKIKPTGTERVIWAEDDGSSLVTFDTKLGKLGGLICWENYMPLARMAMYKKGVEIYIAPTADSRKEWTSTMKHIALEGRCFVLASNQYFTLEHYPAEYRALVDGQATDFCEGGSMIVSPFGEIIAGPLFGSAGVLTAEIDLDQIQQSKLDFDPAGHYHRPDIFHFEVKDQPDIKKEITSKPSS